MISLHVRVISSYDVRHSPKNPFYKHRSGILLKRGMLVAKRFSTNGLEFSDLR
ncbi:hypothetical protein BaRGS_00022291, partial [Batillaria attramentaria]